MATITLTPGELLHVDYWLMARSKVVSLFDKVAANHVFGTVNECLASKMRWYKHLSMYLDFMYEERAMDTLREGTDLGDAYYKELYCIDSIKKSLICRGIDPNLISIYFGSSNIYTKPPDPEVIQVQQSIIKTGSKYIPAETETMVQYRGGSFPDTDYTLSIWAYTNAGNRVELLPKEQQRGYFIISVLEPTTIRYIAAKQLI